MSIYDQIARGFNPGEGAVKSALYRKQDERNKLAMAVKQHQLGINERQQGLQEQKFQQEQANQLRQNMMKAIAWADTPDKWNTAVQHYRAQGIDIPPNWEATPDNLEQLRRQALSNLMTPAQVVDRVAPEPEYGVTNIGTGTPGETQVVSYNKHDPTDYQPLGLAKVARQKGMEVTVGPDGTVRFAQGDGLTTKTRNDIQERHFNASEALARLKGIESSFSPQYLEIGSRLGANWSALKEKAGVGLSAEDRSRLEGFATFKRRSVDNLNQYIRAMSGAAVTAQEAERLKAGLPNAGTGVFDGDSPTEFQAKLTDTMQTIRNAIKRYRLAEVYGLNWRGVSLDQVRTLIQRRGEDLTASFMQQGMGRDEAEQLAIQALAQEIGQ